MKQEKEAIQIQMQAILSERCDDQEALPELVPEYPSDHTHGDLAFPLFPYARILKLSPKDIAEFVVSRLDKQALGVVSFVVAGGYVNVFLHRPPVLETVLNRIASEGDAYGENATRDGETIVIEFSSPNTNKPLHLGHLRNNVIGESVSRLLRTSGAKVHQVCLFNDRGVHICKSMVAYQESAVGKTPQSEQKRGDSFVGDLYVEFAKLAKEDASYEAKAQMLLQAWEAGDDAVRALWKTMREWVVEGITMTYARCGIHFDSFEYESEVYEQGRAIVLEGLQKGVFYKEADASICVDLSEWNLDTKVLLRSDGTTLYVTQDLGTAVLRATKYQCDHMVYVVASEQEYHFAVLFRVLELLGYAWARSCRHLSYGMVQLSSGKMKSREGTVVDAEDLIDTLQNVALDMMQERREKMDDAVQIAESIALGALHYYLLWPHPSTEILFDTQKSLSFSGNTGPYLQYTIARIAAIERKAAQMRIVASLDANALNTEQEWQLVKLLARYPETLAHAASQENPSILAHFVYGLAKVFTMYYHEIPILSDVNYAPSRLFMTRCVGQTLRNCLRLLVIPSVKEM